MKRSKKVALILMVPTTTFMLASCGEDPKEVVVFNNPNECASMVSTMSAEQCIADYQAAKALHPQVAPKYANKSECETDFGAGQCETAPPQTTGSSGFFMPMMMGYMAGQMLSRQGGGQATGAAAGAARNGVNTQPLYKSSDDRGTLRTASNVPVARQSGSTFIRPSQAQPRAGQMVRRGGFGSQAAARNSMGG